MKLSEATIREAIKEVCGEDAELLTIGDFKEVVDELTDDGHIGWYLSLEEDGENFRAARYVTTDFSYTFYGVVSLTDENSVEDVIDLINEIDEKYKTTKVTFLEGQNG